MKSLSIKEATELYSILGKYIPDDVEGDVFTFAGKIMDAIIEDEMHDVYADAIYIMSEKTSIELDSMKLEDVVSLFIEGLAHNKILSLQAFMQGIGFSYV